MFGNSEPIRTFRIALKGKLFIPEIVEKVNQPETTRNVYVRMITWT